MTSYTYQWERCDSAGAGCTDIPGATSPTYLYVAADVGHKIRLRGTRDDGLVETSDPPVGPITAVATSGHCYLSVRDDGAFYTGDDGLGAPYGIASADDAPFCQSDSPPTAYTEWVAHSGKAPTAIHWGGSGTSLSSFDATADGKARLLGAFSLYSMAASAAQLSDLLNNVDTNGGLTAIDNWATAVKAAARPIIARPLWEFNLDHNFIWNVNGASHLTASQYRTVWQRIWQRVADIMGGHTPGSGLGTDTGNVSFFWCPNIAYGVPDPTPWFPGTAGDPTNKYVDWVGFDGYNKGGSGDSPAHLFDTTAGICRALAPGKPLAIGETGCEAPTAYPGGKTQWTFDLAAWVKANADVRLMNLFNEKGEPVRPHIEIGPAATTFGGASQAAFASAFGADPYFIGGGTGVVNSTTFPNGTKVPIPA